MLQRYTRTQAAAAWQPVGDALPVTLAAPGWPGAGACTRNPPIKAHQVRRRRLRASRHLRPTALFGTADPAPLQSASLPFLCASGDLKCVDDPASPHYNQIVDQTRVAQIDWASCGDMLRPDTRYAIGAVVRHNPTTGRAPAPCIFLHVWRDAAMPTAGCTAAALANMSEVCAWLDATANPLLVQLPQSRIHPLPAGLALP